MLIFCVLSHIFFTMVRNSQESHCRHGSGGWSIFLYTKRLGGSIPSQGTYLGCRFTLSWGMYGRQPVNVSASLSLSHFLSLPPLLKPIKVFKKKECSGDNTELTSHTIHNYILQQRGRHTCIN